MEPKIIVNCGTCGKEFPKLAKEVRRRLKLEAKFYCSRTCCGKSTSQRNRTRTRSLEEQEKLKTWGSLNGGSCKDSFSPFKRFLRSAKARQVAKGKDVDITLEYLKEVWETQRGVCPYLGVVLHLDPKDNPNLQASLDRIDSSKGYVKGNVQFISMTVNYAKSSFSEDILYNLFDLIVKAHGCNRFSTELVSK